jgi:hypothetical protein
MQVAEISASHLPLGARGADNSSVVKESAPISRHPTAPGWLATVPAWLLSLAIHLLLAITASVVFQATQSPAQVDESARAGQIVLVRREIEQREYFADDRAPARHAALRPVFQTGEASAGENAAGLPAADSPPLLSGITLPERGGQIPVADSAALIPQVSGSRGKARFPGNSLDEAAILAEDALIPREQIPTGPTAQLSLFGSGLAEGRSFVFVIDRSNSMGGAGLGAIQAAAKELATHIDQLTAEQTFQVIAYNQSAAYLTGRELVPATTDNKRKLINFVANLAAYGQTEHSPALLNALRVKPEVIFLLTDGGDPGLHPGQFQTIRQQAAGRTSIHCIHFGRGPQNEPEHFLKRLAAENRGSYVYVDMNTH